MRIGTILIGAATVALSALAVAAPTMAQTYGAGYGQSYKGQTDAQAGYGAPFYRGYVGSTYSASVYGQSRYSQPEHRQPDYSDADYGYAPSPTYGRVYQNDIGYTPGYVTPPTYGYVAPPVVRAGPTCNENEYRQGW